MQTINIFVKDSSNQMTTHGMGSIIHPTLGCELFKIIFDSTGAINSYYVHENGKNVTLITNREFLSTVSIDGFIIV
jgi:hypothetical protein